MKNLITYLKPKKGAFHIGDDLKGLERAREYVHSDTLFSGLIHSLARLYGKDFVDSLIKDFAKDNPPFVISSGYLRSNERGCFLPKPKFPLPYLKERISEQDPVKKDKILKEYKEIRFLPSSNLKNLLESFSNPNIDIRVLEDAVKGGRTYSDLFINIIRPSSSIDRVSSSSELFFRGETFLKDGVAISIFCRCREDIVEKLKEAFKCFGSFGVGGEKTYGLGQFNVEFDENYYGMEFIFTGTSTVGEKANNFSYLLSLYYPKDCELDVVEKKSFYSMVERKGWFNSPYTNYQFKRRSVMMFEEGSVIGSDSINGCLVDVSPEYWEKFNIPVKFKHKVYRNGLAFSIPFKVEE